MSKSSLQYDVEFHVISIAFQLHSHISVLWPFCRISVISEFLFLDIGLKTKTRFSRKILTFGSMNLR